VRQFALWGAAILLAITVVVPALVVGNWSWESPSPDHVPRAGSVDLFISVFDNDSGTLMELPLEAYLVGVVAAEMPASFHMEALKAQAVVARTYAVGKMRMFGGHGCLDHPQADICTNPDTDQAWESPEELRDKWGMLRYFFYHRKVERAVHDTRGQIATYGGQPIEAVYHSTSGGKTEEASAVWGQERPYLKSVLSPNEEDSPKYSSEQRFTPAELAVCLGVPAVELENELRRDGVRIVERTAGGRAATVAIGNRTWSGREFREALDLHSTWFSVEVTGNDVVFSLKGYGHGVGMSQYGADAMAKRGKTYVDIIKHYYTGVSVRPIFAE